MPRKSTAPVRGDVPTIVTFDFEERTYQIDPERRKVYRRFVQIETSKAMEIFALWRSQNASA